MGKRDPEEPRYKQLLALQGIVEGKTPMQAMLDAGYSENTADHPKRELLEKPGVKQLFKEVLEAAGATDELLALRLREGLDAQETRFFQKDGRVTAKRTVVDFAQRHNYLETVLRLKGHLIEKHEITGHIDVVDLLAASWDGEKVAPLDHQEEIIEIEALPPKETSE